MLLAPAAFGTAALTANAASQPLRRVISLDGAWQIAEGKMDAIPAEFSRTVPVPGLVDMAVPAFVEPGPAVAKRNAIPQKDPRRDAFWYRRRFTVDGPIPETATLKVAKAMFGTRVFVNGQLLGDHVPCWTPGFFHAKPALKPGENEVVIRVGADRDAVGRGYPDGFDFEKSRYIPGIFDSVSLALSGTPRIENVQVAPDIAGQRARVRVYLDGSQGTDVEVEIREAGSARLAGSAAANVQAGVRECDVTVPIADCRLWSPEDPFLYRVTVRTRGDQF
ncbi:MAG: glycoside hydrolase family 2 protein, partial [Thermoguttaceae bacterium]